MSSSACIYASHRRCCCLLHALPSQELVRWRGHVSAFPAATFIGMHHLCVQAEPFPPSPCPVVYWLFALDMHTVLPSHIKRGAVLYEICWRETTLKCDFVSACVWPAKRMCTYQKMWRGRIKRALRCLSKSFAVLDYKDASHKARLKTGLG